MTTPRKPVTRKVRSTAASWGVRSELAVTLFPSGQLSIREHGRHESSAITFELSELYCLGLKRKIQSERKAKRKK